MTKARKSKKRLSGVVHVDLHRYEVTSEFKRTVNQAFAGVLASANLTEDDYVDAKTGLNTSASDWMDRNSAPPVSDALKILDQLSSLDVVAQAGAILRTDRHGDLDNTRCLTIARTLRALDVSCQNRGLNPDFRALATACEAVATKWSAIRDSVPEVRGQLIATAIDRRGVYRRHLIYLVDHVLRVFERHRLQSGIRMFNYDDESDTRSGKTSNVAIVALALSAELPLKMQPVSFGRRGRLVAPLRTMVELHAELNRERKRAVQGR